MYNNILVIADQDCDQHAAMQKARSIAFNDDIKISVVGFVEPERGETDGSVGEKNSALQNAIDTEFAGMANVSYEAIATNDIAGYCKTYTNDKGIDLVVKTGHRSENLFHTPLDFQLVRELSCPVMISTLQKWRAKHRVMVTLDIDSTNANQIALNKKVVHWANNWAQCQQCELHVAYCIPIAGAMTELDIVSKDEVLVKQEASTVSKIKAFMEEQNVEYSSISVNAGKPQRVLPSIANKLKADLVVLGSVGRKGIQGILLGNTAEKTMSRLRTDLAVIHPD